VQRKRNAEAQIDPRPHSQAILLGLASGYVHECVHQPVSDDKFHHSRTRLPRMSVAVLTDGGPKSIGAEKLESMGLYIAGVGSWRLVDHRRRTPGSSPRADVLMFDFNQSCESAIRLT
jgi:hypothetical protein